MTPAVTAGGDAESLNIHFAEPDPEEPCIPTQPYELFVANVRREPGAFYVEPIAKLAEIVGRLVAREGPIHEKEVLRRLSRTWGLSRAGGRVQARADRAVRAALSAERIVRNGSFFWPPDMAEPPVRRRQGDDVRDAELICLAEIAHAARMVLDVQFAMRLDDLIAQVARALGFRAGGARLAERITQAVDAELHVGRIVKAEDDLLRPAPPKQD